jgi:hypothetical protein
MRSFTNIGKKNNKVVPARIDFDTAPTPIFEVIVVRILTTRAHFNPNIIKRMFFSYVTSMTMTIVAGMSYASAGANAIWMKVRNSSGVEIITIAFTQPQCATASSFANRFNCNQSTETLTCDICSSGRRTARSVRGSSGEVAL